VNEREEQGIVPRPLPVIEKVTQPNVRLEVGQTSEYENDASNALFGSIDRSVVRQSNFPRYGQIGIKLLF
jgi:hypothetical protein